MTGTPAAGSLAPMLLGLIEEAQRAEREGHRELARRRYESVLYLLRPGGGATASMLLRRIARTYIDDGQFDVALDCLAAALAIAEALDERPAVAQVFNSMATAHLQRGELEIAEQHYLRARTAAHRLDDQRLAAMVSQNLGIIANMRGELESALEHYAASLGTYRSLGSDEFVGLVLNNMAMAFAQLERWDEAQAAYEEALNQCERIGDITSSLMVQVNLADMWLARNDWARAADLCQAVLLQATVAGDQRALGENFKHRGMIARHRGDVGTAEQHFAAAYENAMAREDLLLAAETAREQAELFETTGRNKDTLRTLAQSYRLFGKLRANRDLADLARRVSRLEDRFLIVVRRWADTIESKDPYTLGHCERVAHYASALARDVGFDDMTMFWFRIGALLHDVGKIVVPFEILTKAGPLTEEEREIMQRHPVAGESLLRDIDFAWDVLPMIRGHHERWDGRGYPDGLAGESIAMSARILCIADVYDALTSDRPYRVAFSRDDALFMMRGQSAMMFDPSLLARFNVIIREIETPQAVSGTRHLNAG
jgi:putative nucleotidyltransferase with HDIG domain